MTPFNWTFWPSCALPSMAMLLSITEMFKFEP